MITIQIKNAEKLSEIFRKYPEISGKNFNNAIRKSFLQIETDAKIGAPKDTGALKARWEKSYGFLRGSLSSGMDYAIYVEEGTRPHMPPIEKITPWANNHGIPPFLVARSIARKGTKARFFFRDAIEKNMQNIENNFNEALSNTINEL